MNLGPNSIHWCDSFRYLGVTFHAGLKLKTYTEVIKQKFFMTSNSVLGNSRSLPSKPDHVNPTSGRRVICRHDVVCGFATRPDVLPPCLSPSQPVHVGPTSATRRKTQRFLTASRSRAAEQQHAMSQRPSLAQRS